MARKARNSNQQPPNGVDEHGGSSQGGDPGTGSGGEPGSGGSDSGSDGNGSVITPSLGNGNGDGNGDGDSGARRSDAGRTRRAYKPRAQKTELDLSVVIEFANFGLGQIAGQIWAMDGGEVQQFSAAAQKVLRHYDTPEFSAKAMDWVGLAMVVGKIYGPRIAHAIASAPKRQPAQPQTSGAPAPAPETPRRPREPVMEQREGYVRVSHPSGDGTMIDVPIQQ